MKKKYWLRGGFTGLVIFFPVVVTSFYLFNTCNVSRIGDWSCIKYLVLSNLPGWFVYKIFNTNLNYGSINLDIPIILFISAAIYFIIGLLIGWLYGKIKNRNKA